MFNETDETKTTINNTVNVGGNVYGNVYAQYNSNSNGYPCLIDTSNKPGHFSLMTSPKSIDEVFIDGCYKIIYSKDFLEEESTINPSLNNCVQLIEEIKILLIEGEYGTGKTILTKSIQKLLKDEGFNTLFYESSDFTEISAYNELENIAANAKEPIYLFIDSIDDLNNLLINNDNAIVFFLKKIFDVTYNYNNVFFIINSRPHLRIVEKSEKVSLQFAFLCSEYKKPCNYIHMREFENKEINEFFLNLNTTKGDSLNTTNLKNWHKKSLESCRNQLFAFVIGTYFYDHYTSLPKNILVIYKHFITKTINGKFSDERIEGSKFVEVRREQYRQLLRTLARDMIAYKAENIDYKYDESAEEGLLFFRQKKSFAIKLSNLKESTKELFYQYYAEKDILQKITHDANFLNCYFFKVYFDEGGEAIVSFSDNNIMCYLAAELAYEKFLNVAASGSSSTKEKLVDGLSDFQLHPQAMDFLIGLLRGENCDVLDQLTSKLKDIINEFDANQDISLKTVKAQLVIQIVFIKLFNKSYKSINSQHFFKNFDKLCKTAKALELNGKHIENKHRYLAERYFMHCSFIECCFRRLNLKFYNFKGSKIKQSIFEQCKLEDNTLTESVIEDSTFFLCLLNSINFDAIIIGSLNIDNCKIFKCRINGDDIANNESQKTCFHFKECSIEKLDINNLRYRSIHLEFEKCFIKEMHLNNCNTFVKVKNCVVENPIKIIASDLKLYQENNLTTSTMIITQDNQSKVIPTTEDDI